ncbi:hypothetical protein F4820DRAFT_471852 [Hypoxylon rubiginosum]|uniref:Uncharacterized protein n=1 Tax=Hypoxylon rubiginosum TaxID=110542 RepID=A0ACB9YWS1_9PEZI|nr:hypothetical protein F4820DRAFT_471852 [Hypoxylon rubiginosum]
MSENNPNSAQPNGAPVINQYDPNSAQPNGAPVVNQYNDIRMADASQPSPSTNANNAAPQTEQPHQGLTPSAAEALSRSQWSNANEAPVTGNQPPGGSSQRPAASASTSNQQHGRGDVIQFRPERTTIPLVRWGNQPTDLFRDGNRFRFRNPNGRELNNEMRIINDNTTLGTLNGPRAWAETTSRMTSMFGEQDQIHLLVYRDDRAAQRQLEYEESRNWRRRFDPLERPGARRQAQLHSAGAHDPNRRSRPANAPQRPRRVRCGNCGGVGHQIARCVWPSDPAGDIPGCYRCNRRGHTIDNCALQPPMDDQGRYTFEITNRMGLPPLRSTRGWNELAIQYGMLSQGPISRQMMLRLDPNHFESWDYEKKAEEQSILLVQDEATANLDRVRQLPDQGYRSILDNRTANSSSNVSNAVQARLEQERQQQQEQQQQSQIQAQQEAYLQVQQAHLQAQQAAQLHDQEQAQLQARQEAYNQAQEAHVQAQQAHHQAQEAYLQTQQPGLQ